MFFQQKILLWATVAVVGSMSAVSASTYEWSSVMGQARALHRSVRDLNRAVERSRVPYAVRVTARLESAVCVLVDVLDHDRCIADVRDAQNEVQLWLERTVVAIEDRCDPVANPRLTNAVDNVLANFERLSERINDRILPPSNIYRRPPIFLPPDHMRILPYPFPITAPAPIRVPQPRLSFPPARNPGDWHQSNVPGYVSPGDWHYTQVPGAISPGSWHPINTP